MEGKEEMHPRPKAQRRGRARGEPHLFRVEGAGVCTSRPLVSQPVQGGRWGQDRAAGVRRGESRVGGASWEASCQFQTK